MNIQLSDHFTYRRLIRFVIPSVAMMILTSIYGVVDGLFVSNFVGKTAFAAVNLVIPFTLVLGAFGFMLGTGGTALVAKTLGEGKQEEANRIFSMLIYFAIGLGLVLTMLGIAALKKILLKMGADDAMLGYGMIYGRLVLLGIPFYMLQNMFQNFLIAAEKPQLGNGCGRADEYGSGCAVHCGAWLGRGRCGGGNGIGAMCRRLDSLCLFCKEKQQSACLGKNKITGGCAAANLYERLLRAGVEYFHVLGGNAL